MPDKDNIIRLKLCGTLHFKDTELQIFKDPITGKTYQMTSTTSKPMNHLKELNDKCRSEGLKTIIGVTSDASDSRGIYLEYDDIDAIDLLKNLEDEIREIWGPNSG